jgi:transcriptional regulator with XRE-family HTH domain
MTRSTSSRRRAADQGSRAGTEVKLARARHGMSARQVARRAGVSWDTVQRIELGDPNVAISTLCAVAEAVGLDLVVRTYDGRSPSLRDTGQLQLAQRLMSEGHASLKPALELSIGTQGSAIDLAFFGPLEILAIEIERLILDFQDQFRRADRKRRAIADMHQRSVRLVLAIEDRPRNRAAVRAHLALIATALPARSREILNAIRTGGPLGRDGILWLRRRSPAR